MMLIFVPLFIFFSSCEKLSSSSTYNKDLFLILHDKSDLLNHPAQIDLQRIFITNKLIIATDREVFLLLLVFYDLIKII